MPFAEGSVMLRTDADGRLRSLLAIPPRADTLAETSGTPYRQELFASAQLDTARFHEVAPVRRPLLPFDVRREWVGESDLWPGSSLRVTASWWHGQPVSFAVRGPWDDAAQSRARNGNPISNVVRLLITIALTVLCIVSGSARLATGKSDWRGGLRFANVVLILYLVHWLFSAHHTLVVDAEGASAMRAFSDGLMAAFVMFFLYVVIEPEVRRRTPELLIGWARLIQGRWNDPRVGRDVLVGSVVGAASIGGLALVNAIPSWVPFKGQTPIPPNTDVITGGQLLFAQFTAIPLQTFGTAFALFGVWFLFWLAFRRKLPAAIGLAVIMTLLALGAENPTLEVPGAIVDGVLIAYVITRHGLLALVTAWTIRLSIQGIPVPFTTTSPFAFSAFAAILVPVAIAFLAFRISSSGTPPRSDLASDG